MLELRSTFLLDIKAQFTRPIRPSLKDVEVEERPGDSVLDESLEVLRHVSRGHDLFVYQALTVWGDQVATYTVRETVKKRRYRLVYQVNEFPLFADPESIASTFWWAATELAALGVPPGEAGPDRERLRRIEERWLGLSKSTEH